MQPGNPDIRGEVDSSRGLLKKIQLHLPLFEGYRKLEDLRAADELLRKQIAGVLQRALQSLENERVTLVNAGDFEKLTLIGASMSKIQQFQGEIMHAEQGYSGISPSIRFDEGKLNLLYEYDLKFLETTSTILEFSNFTSSSEIGVSLSKLNNSVDSARMIWNQRLESVTNILQSTGGKQ